MNHHCDTVRCPAGSRLPDAGGRLFCPLAVWRNYLSAAPEIAPDEGPDRGEGFAGGEAKGEGETVEEAAERVPLAVRGAGGDFVTARGGIVTEVAAFQDDVQQGR